MALALDNVRLLTGDFAATFRFYADGLGLAVLFGTVEGPYAELAAGPASIGLLAREQMPGASAAAVGDQTVVVLHAEPLEAALAELRGRGLTVDEARERREWGIRTAHLRDPDGRMVELFEPIEPVGPQQH